MDRDRAMRTPPRLERAEGPRWAVEAIRAVPAVGGSTRMIRGDGGLDLAYRVAGWKDAGGWDGRKLVEVRELTAWFLDHDNPVGVATFKEFDVAPCLDDMEFVEIMDMDSHANYVLAEAVVSGWEIEALADFGIVVEFHQMWVGRDHSRASAWADPIDKLLRRRWIKAGGRASLLLLKPFPLEHEGRYGEGETAGPCLERRIRALRRMYSRHLGVAPLHDGTWMWRSLQGGVDLPADRPRYS